METGICSRLFFMSELIHTKIQRYGKIEGIEKVLHPIKDIERREGLLWERKKIWTK